MGYIKCYGSCNPRNNGILRSENAHLVSCLECKEILERYSKEKDTFSPNSIGDVKWRVITFREHLFANLSCPIEYLAKTLYPYFQFLHRWAFKVRKVGGYA